MQEKANKSGQQDSFSQLVREKIKNYQAPVDDYSLTRIEQALNSNRRKTPLWVWISTAVAASFALLLFLRISYREVPTKENITTKLVNNFNEKSYQPIPEPTINTDVSFKTEKVASSQKTVKQIFGKETHLITEKIPEINEIQTVEAIVSQDTEGQPVQNESEKRSSNSQVTEHYNFNREQEAKTITRKKKSNKWLLAASFGSGSRNSPEGNFASGDDYFAKNPSGEFNGDHPSSEKIDDVFYLEEFSDITHYVPLSFGINIRKDINKHWAVESGLTYTYLLSKYKSHGENYSEAAMKMHYIGVPLNLVAYLSNSNPQWNLYVSAGGMIEKGLQLDFNRNRYINDYIVTTKLKEDIPGWQYSLNASVGAGYKIHKDISFYVEPRITYYLNNNQPENVRTKNPLIMGFNTGLRFGF